MEVTPARRLGGRVVVPGDKSVSHRALMFAALAHGATQVTNLAPGADVRSTASVLQQLGVAVSLGQGGTAEVHGRGLEGLRASAEPLDCGNSGTTMRLMMGVLAAAGIDAVLVGDASLTRRPMGRVAKPLEAMGARFQLSEGGRPPVRVAGGALRGAHYASPVASAQIKSAVLLAGLGAAGATTVVEPARSRDHTERMLGRMGARLRVDGVSVTIEPGPLTALGRVEVPGDLSSAAYLLAAGLLVDGDGVTAGAVGVNPTRVGFLEAVAAMGATVAHSREVDVAGEPVADLTVRRQRLSAIDLRGEAVVRAIDEVPILAVLATQAHGRTVIADAGELRVKECDRLAACARVLNAMGGRVEERPDGLIIDGPTPLRAATVDSEHDHRIAMAAAIAGLVAHDGPTRIQGAEHVGISYPGFFDDLAALRA